MTPQAQALKALIDALPAEEREALIAACAPASTAPASLRLLRPVEAARAMNVSTTSIWRMRKERRLPFVEIRRGSVRIPEQAIRDFVEGRA